MRFSSSAAAGPLGFETALLAAAALSAAALLGAALSGCASGGRPGAGNRDAGPVGNLDAGPIASSDAGPMPDSGPVVSTDSGPLPAADSGPPPAPDSGPPPTPDAGPPDAGPPGCTSDTECDDGLACNGMERCDPGGTCLPGTPPVCDDGIACTRSECVEGSGCVHTPDDALCPAGQSCGATGCVSACSESPCRLTSPQCGCPSGQGCYLSGGARGCAAAGTAAEGTPCTIPDSCQPGLVCLNVSTTSTPVNQCSRFCASDGDCVGDGSLCTYTLGDGAGGTIPGVRVCSRACDPVTSAGCSLSAVCHGYRDTAGRPYTDCEGPAGTGGPHAFCTSDASCRRGTFCNPTFGECLAYCRSDFDCPLTDVCYRFATPFVVGGVEVGYCDYW